MTLIIIDMFLQVGEVLDMWKEDLGRPNYLYVLHDLEMAVFVM